MKEKIMSVYNASSGTLMIRFLAAWCFTAVFTALYADGTYYDLDGFKKTGLLFTVGLLVFMFAVFTAMSMFFKKIKTDVILLPVFFGLYSFLIALNADSWYTIFCFGALWALLWFYYSSKGYAAVKSDFPLPLSLFYVGAAALGFMLLAGVSGVLRYKTFSAPNYDFGIFCNMFHNMKTHFLPVTTCERDVYLSHFSIHLSPICYLLLPVYFVFPSGATLQMCQTILLASGVIPVFLICKKYRLTNFGTVLVSCVYSLSPILVSGMNYDFHENCFLAPLLLWMFYFFEKEKYPLFALFAALTMCVKEDAAVYVAFFALYMIFARKKVLAGSITALFAVIYFSFAVYYLSKYGCGVMTDRYGNYIAENGGLAEMVKNVLADPAYVLSQLFMSKDHSYSDKLLFVLQMTLPLGFLPFTAKKPARLILLLPMVMINLMTLYVYQYRIGYQYAFGPFAFLFYMSIINLSELRSVRARFVLNTAAVITAMCFVFTVLPRISNYVSLYTSGKENYAVMEEALDAIPADKSVVCSTFLLPHLAERDEIYEIEYHDPGKSGASDYIVLDMRYAASNDYIEQYSVLGYEITDTVENNGRELLVIMQPMT